MAKVTPQHYPAVTAGFIALLVGTLIGVGILNRYANHH